MKIQKLLEGYENKNITPELARSFDNIFKRIQKNVKDKTDIDINPKWVSGLLNQQHDFKKWEDRYQQAIKDNRPTDARDLMARIVTKYTLETVGLIKNDKIQSPPTASLMRQYYTQPIHDTREVSDPGKLVRNAGESDYQEWFKALEPIDQRYVTNLQEIDPNEFAQFKGLVKAKENKKAFTDRLYDWVNSNESSYKLLRNMRIVDSQGNLDIKSVEDFRDFLEHLSIPRLKDVLSKSSVYTGKKMAHDEQRAANAVFKDMEKNPDSAYQKIINIYNEISPSIANAKDKRRSLYRMLEKVPGAIDEDNKLTKLGKGVFVLFKQFNGTPISDESVKDATQELNNAYYYPADRGRRNAKAETRGQAIRKISEI